MPLLKAELIEKLATSIPDVKLFVQQAAQSTGSVTIQTSLEPFSTPNPQVQILDRAVIGSAQAILRTCLDDGHYTGLVEDFKYVEGMRQMILTREPDSAFLTARDKEQIRERLSRSLIYAPSFSALVPCWPSREGQYA